MSTEPTRPAGRAVPPEPEVRPWRPLVTLTTVLGALVVAVAVNVGVLATFVVVGIGMIALAAGWVLLLGLPSPRGTTAVLGGAALILLASGALSQEARESLLPGAVALAMIVEFVHQLARRDGRPRLVQSVSASITGITLLTSMACVLLLAGTPSGIAATTAVMVAVAAAALADLSVRCGLGDRVAGLAAIALGALAALACVPVLAAAPPLWLLASGGALAGAASYGMRATQSVLPTLFGHRAQVASGIAAVYVTGVIAYALAWFVLGAHGVLT